MILVSPELDEFNPSNWELKPFDLKMKNDLARNHPYQRTMFLVYKYYASYDDEVEGEILFEIDYFQLLDRYYRYGITFEDSDLYPEEFFGFGVPFNNKLYVYEDFIKNYQFRYILKNRYDLKQLLFNDVKTINLDDADNGPITLSEVEKWKRKVINKQTDRKTKLRLLDPNIYHSLITFVVFSKFEGRSNNKIVYDLSFDGIEGVDRKLNNYKNKYYYTKIYEDKIFNKISGFLTKIF